MTTCSVHEVPCVWKEGVSKAGKAYAFWACPMKDAEGNFCKAEKIDDGEQTPAATLAGKAKVMAATIPSYREKVEQPNWEEISRGKVRCQVAVAVIGQGMGTDPEVGLTKELTGLMEEWVDYIMSGPPQEQN